ncbi:Protein CELLULOSE SYNTHASE INTERACTIVE 3 [Bienertia sinuspersici]
MQALSILARIWDPNKQMKLKFYSGPVNSSTKISEPKSEYITPGANGNKEDVKDMLDSTLAARLVDILRIGSPYLQTKIASILEFFAMVEPCKDTVISTDIGSALIDIFKQIVLKGTGYNFAFSYKASPSITLTTPISFFFLAYNIVLMSLKWTFLDLGDGVCGSKFGKVEGIRDGLRLWVLWTVDGDTKTSTEDEEPNVVYIEEVGLAASQASRLLTRLLDYQKFRETFDLNQFTKLLRHVLRSSDISLYHKEWIAACLIRLSFFLTPFENPITTEVTLYETIPRLIDQLEITTSADVQEGVVVELNQIVSEGVVDATRAVAAHGGIFPLVKVLDQGSEKTIEASLAILYNLSMDSENHSAILAAGAAPILRRIILSQKPQWTRALHLLRNLPV